jgi:Reverse transcriptase (RNA-dependent DNA polymerase)
LLDTLPRTATGFDNNPAWFLRIGAPFFAAPNCSMMILSLLSSIVPRQWRTASILPIPKTLKPLSPSDYRPISITSVLTRLLERVVVTDYIYPSFQCPRPNLSFSDQFAFQPTASTTVASIHRFHTITALLDTNRFVIVYAQNFSKAFDSVRHSAVLDKYLQLQIPDNVCNWLESFFRDHSHCTKFGNEVSEFRKIMASIIQGSGIGPASYVVTASDLHPVTSGNIMDKYADDTYLVIPAANVDSCAAEIAHVEDWAVYNNLRLNRTKSAEIVFIFPMSKRANVIPPPVVPEISRVDSIKVLGVTVSRRFSASQHIDAVLAGCAQTSFALRILRQHGMPDSALRVVFQATVESKMSYAASAWWGYTSAADRGRLEALLRRSVSFGYRDASAPSLTRICAQADRKLFNKILQDERHLLRTLLPPERSQHHSLRQRRHNLQLPART